MPRGERILEHLLRRAGFGVSDAALMRYSEMTYADVVDTLVYYEDMPDVVDRWIGQPGYIGSTIRQPQTTPNTVINDARQRWLFRMIHSERPLQEKMALFWHNHFATAYSKVAGIIGGTEATRALAAKPSEDPGGQKGQLELFREHATGSFRRLLFEVSKDVAMIYWLDGQLNTRTRPQENFAREVMELFTVGVGNHTEPDVYAAARVFTGWHVRFVGTRGTPEAHYEFYYNAAQHETSAKEFSFPIYPNGSRTIPARSAAEGMQDGIDLINALATSPLTARRLARKLYAFFVSELHEPEPAFIARLAEVYLANDTELKPVLRELFLSPEFQDRSKHFARYSWPVEFVVRSIKEVGWEGFSTGSLLTPLINMGQQLFEPPDVAGWDLGRNWFSTAAMLARMNFAAALASNQRFNLANSVNTGLATAPSSLVFHLLDRLTAARYDEPVLQELIDYVGAGTTWRATPQQLQAKVPGLVHLILGSGEYQFV